MEHNCLHIITRLANGGAEETVFDLILELAKHGVYCDLAVGKECLPEVLAKYDLPTECNIITIPHLVRNPHPIYDLKALREIRVLIRKNKYNIVQTHGSKAGILGRIAAHKETIPAIIGMIHGISFPLAMGFMTRTLYKGLEKYVARFSDALVCVGEDMKQKYITAGIGKPEQYSVIYTGMKLNLSSQTLQNNKSKQKIREDFGLPQDPETIVLGSIGRLEDRKNQKELIKMLPILIKKVKKIHLVLIGDGPNMKPLLKYTQQLGVADYISFTGYISNVWKILPAIDIHCMVSLWEGLPRVLVQTSSAKIPNVCYEVDGAWEIVEHEKSGYIIPRGDALQYIDKLVYLATNHKARKECGAQAFKLADSRWSLDKFGEDTLTLYKSLLSR